MSKELRDEWAKALGIDLSHASVVERAKVNRAVTLDLYIQDQHAAKEAGRHVDIPDIERASRMLDEMAPQPAAAQGQDISIEQMGCLTVAEATEFSFVCAKMTGLSLEEIAEQDRRCRDGRRDQWCAPAKAIGALEVRVGSVLH